MFTPLLIFSYFTLDLILEVERYDQSGDERDSTNEQRAQPVLSCAEYVRRICRSG